MPVNSESNASSRKPRGAGAPPRAKSGAMRGARSGTRPARGLSPKPATSGRARASLRGEITEVFRNAILDAAEAEFGGRGFADAKMTQIAERAGVAAGTLYNYFDSKESILRALVELRRKQLGDGLRRIAVGPGSARDKLLGLTSAVLGFIQSKSAMFSVFEQTGGMTGCYVHGAAAKAGKAGTKADSKAGTKADSKADTKADSKADTKGERFVPRQLVVFEEILVQAVREKLVRSDLPTRELTEVFTGSIHGVVRGWLLHGQKEPLAERAPFLVNLFLKGAGIER